MGLDEDSAGIESIPSQVEAGGLEICPCSGVPLLDGSSSGEDSPLELDDEDVEVVESRFECGREWLRTDEGLELLRTDLQELFTRLELAEDCFEGGDRPLAKLRRAAAAASAARTVEEPPF